MHESHIVGDVHIRLVDTAPAELAVKELTQPSRSPSNQDDPAHDQHYTPRSLYPSSKDSDCAWFTLEKAGTEYAK